MFNEFSYLALAWYSTLRELSPIMAVGRLKLEGGCMKYFGELRGGGYKIFKGLQEGQ